MIDLLDSTDVIIDFEYSGVCMLAADEPANVEQALEEHCWKQAMDAEMQSIIQNKTWVLSDLPKDHKAIAAPSFAPWSAFRGELILGSLLPVVRTRHGLAFVVTTATAMATVTAT